MYRPKQDICAGTKNPFPKMKVYQRKVKESKPDEKKKKYTFELLEEVKDTVSSVKNILNLLRKHT